MFIFNIYYLFANFMYAFIDIVYLLAFQSEFFMN